ERDAVERQHVGGGAVVDAVLFRVGHDVMEAVDHDFFHAVVDQLLVPKVALTVLDPFEVRDRDAAGVREDVGNNEDAFFAEDGIGQMGGGAISSFTENFAPQLVGVLGCDDVFACGGQQNVGFEEHGIVTIDVFGFGEIENGAGFFAIFHEGG